MYLLMGLVPVLIFLEVWSCVETTQRRRHPKERETADQNSESSTALRSSSNDDGNRKLEIPEQPEYDVEGINFKELLKGDPTTLTLVGFGLIAFNFFVLAGFGSGGL